MDSPCILLAEATLGEFRTRGLLHSLAAFDTFRPLANLYSHVFWRRRMRTAVLSATS